MQWGKWFRFRRRRRRTIEHLVSLSRAVVALLHLIRAQKTLLKASNKIKIERHESLEIELSTKRRRLLDFLFFFLRQSDDGKAKRRKNAASGEKETKKKKKKVNSVSLFIIEFPSSSLSCDLARGAHGRCKLKTKRKREREGGRERESAALSLSFAFAGGDRCDASLSLAAASFFLPALPSSSSSSDENKESSKKGPLLPRAAPSPPARS